MPTIPWKQPGQCGKYQSVLWLQARTIDLATQHRDFMSQDEQLDVLGGFTTAS
jgi:hypothetical protein